MGTYADLRTVRSMLFSHQLLATEPKATSARSRIDSDNSFDESNDDDDADDEHIQQESKTRPRAAPVGTRTPRSPKSQHQPRIDTANTSDIVILDALE